jgi:hypothetical protein
MGGWRSGAAEEARSLADAATVEVGNAALTFQAETAQNSQLFRLTWPSAAIEISFGISPVQTGRRGILGSRCAGQESVPVRFPIKLKQVAHLQREADGRGWPRLACCRP